MQIVLDRPELESFVQDQVNAGRFDSASAVIEAALARLMLDELPADLHEEDKAAIERAEEEFDRGEDRDFSEAAAELRARYIPRPG